MQPFESLRVTLIWLGSEQVVLASLRNICTNYVTAGSDVRFLSHRRKPRNHYSHFTYMSKDNTIEFENNWLSKSLENLEKSVWPALPSDEGSHLIQTCHALRKKQLKDFTTEDLREMIGQDIGLKYLVPLAIRTLEKNILAEGDLYEGDLLKSVLTSDKKFWSSSRDNWTTVCELVENNLSKLNEADTTHDIRKSWFSSYKNFRQI